MTQAERLTQREAVDWARLHTDRERRTHHVYRLDPAGEAVRGLHRLTYVLPRFLVRPEGVAPPDGAKLVATTSFSKK